MNFPTRLSSSLGEVSIEVTIETSPATASVSNWNILMTHLPAIPGSCSFSHGLCDDNLYPQGAT